jgi:hypothetical protein
MSDDYYETEWMLCGVRVELCYIQQLPSLMAPALCGWKMI